MWRFIRNKINNVGCVMHSFSCWSDPVWNVSKSVTNNLNARDRSWGKWRLDGRAGRCCVSPKHSVVLFHLTPHLRFRIPAISALIGFVLFFWSLDRSSDMIFFLHTKMFDSWFTSGGTSSSRHEARHYGSGIWNAVWSLWCVVQISESFWVSGSGRHTDRLLNTRFGRCLYSKLADRKM